MPCAEWGEGCPIEEFAVITVSIIPNSHVGFTSGFMPFPPYSGLVNSDLHFSKIYYLNFNYVYICIWKQVCTHECTCLGKGRRGHWVPQSCIITGDYVLWATTLLGCWGQNFGSCARVACCLNNWALSFIQEAEWGRFRGLSWLWFVSGASLCLACAQTSSSRSLLLTEHLFSGHSSFPPTSIYTGPHETNFGGVLAESYMVGLCGWPPGSSLIGSKSSCKNVCSNLKPQWTVEKSQVWQLLNW